MHTDYGFLILFRIAHSKWAAVKRMLLEKEGNTKALSAILVSATLIGVILSSPLIFGLLTRTTTVGSAGIIKAINVGVYEDVNCTTAVSSINWGMVEPGSSANETIYVRNEGNAEMTLSLGTQNWSPSEASGYITLSWDYAGSIGPGEVVEVTLTLSVSAGIEGITNYGFDIVITGTG